MVSSLAAACGVSDLGDWLDLTKLMSSQIVQGRPSSSAARAAEGPENCSDERGVTALTSGGSRGRLGVVARAGARVAGVFCANRTRIGSRPGSGGRLRVAPSGQVGVACWSRWSCLKGFE